MKNLPFEQKLMNYLRASYPMLYIRTPEESRVIRSIINAASNTKKTQVTVYSWDCRHLLEKHTQSPESDGNWNWVKVTATGINGDFGLANVVDNMLKLCGVSGRSIFIMKDFHAYIETPGIIRALRNAIRDLTSKGNMIIFVSPVIKIPVELERDIQILDFKLPDEVQLEGILTSVYTIYNKGNKAKNKPEVILDADIKQGTIEALKGLTFSEAHDACSLSIMENHEFSNDFILSVFEEKVKQVKRNGHLQYLQPDITFDQIGGLDGLKKWIRARAKAYSLAARSYGLPYPKGMLLAGFPGTGNTIA